MTRRILALMCLAILISCQKSLPTPPSSLGSGIVVYEHANYLGDSAHIDTDIDDLRDFKGPCTTTTNCGQFGCDVTETWNDCISSVRVAPGWHATLYQDDGFRDDRLNVSEDIPNLQLIGGCSSRGFNDCVTSIRVFRP